MEQVTQIMTAQLTFWTLSFWETHFFPHQAAQTGTARLTLTMTA
jgi:hypothetical protein